MKKFLFLTLTLMRCVLTGVFCLLSSVCYGAWNDQNLLNRASFTPTSDTLAYVPLTYGGTVLKGVILSSEAATSVKIYDSSGVVSNQIAFLGSATPGGSNYIPFNVRLSSGLTYTTAGNTLGVTFIYLRVRP